ncbi:MAG: DUF3617 domain-containing protein [Rhizomicrobium sp.]
MRAGVWAAGIAAVAIVAVPALASHGKAGLWDVTVKMSMPNMPQMPPDQIAKMKAMGVSVPNGNTMTVQHCMTEAEVTADTPPQMQQNKDCSMQNMKQSGGSFSAEMVCNGPDMQGSGHFQVTYDSDSHYSGSMAFSGVSHGHPTTMTNNFEGHWVSASCGNVGH